MDVYVCDTHTLFWYLTSSPKLGRVAKGLFARADDGEVQVVIPAIVWCELFFLNDKIGAPLDVAAELDRVRNGKGYACPPFHPDEISLFGVLSAVPEMHDRMIVGTAYRLGVPCLTRDSAIAASGLVSCIFDS